MIVTIKDKECSIWLESSPVIKAIGISRYKLNQMKEIGFGEFEDVKIYFPDKIQTKSNRGGFREGSPWNKLRSKTLDLQKDV